MREPQHRTQKRQSKERKQSSPNHDLDYDRNPFQNALAGRADSLAPPQSYTQGVDLIAHNNDDLRQVQSPTQDTKLDPHQATSNQMQKSGRFSHNDLLDEEEQRLQEQINRLHLEESNKLRAIALNQPTNLQYEQVPMPYENENYVEQPQINNMDNYVPNESSDHKLYNKIHERNAKNFQSVIQPKTTGNMKSF